MERTTKEFERLRKESRDRLSSIRDRTEETRLKYEEVAEELDEGLFKKVVNTNDSEGEE